MTTHPTTEIELSDSYQRRGILATATVIGISEHGEDLRLDIELEIEHMTYATVLERRDRVWTAKAMLSDDPQAIALNAALESLAKRHGFDFAPLRTRLSAEFEGQAEEAFA